MKVLMIGGKWDVVGGRPSGLFAKIANRVSETHDAVVLNGGDYWTLPQLMETCANYDCVFWMADVPNQFDKTRDVKQHAPYVMLVTSKRNDNARYDEREVVMRAITSKSNLLIEFSYNAEFGKFDMRAIDPLGNAWYEGNDPNAIADAVMDRIKFLASMRREGTTCEDEHMSVPEQEAFVQYVRRLAETVQTLTLEQADTPRFLGNASFRETRCMKTFPSFRDGETVFVSRRNVSKTFIEMSDFVPVRLGNGRLLYKGQHKPSVDSPIQARLYQALPNINYMVHVHCYVDGAPSTKRCVPCGALQEVDEVLDVIRQCDNGLDGRAYVINLRGHGSILMAASLDEMPKVEFHVRPMPEYH